MSENNILTNEQKAENAKTNKGCLKIFGYITLVLIGLAIIGYIIQLTESPQDKLERLTKDSINKAIEIENIKIKKENEKLEKANSNKFTAITMCEKFVSQKLKSPSTAEFCSSTDYKILNNPKTTAGLWSLEGWVDSQNGFGAIIRTKFQIHLQYDIDTDLWTEVYFVSE